MKFHKIDTRGKFWLPQETSKASVTHGGSVDEGRIFYSIAEDAIYYGDQDEWKLIARKEDVITDGTKVIMGTYPLPVYWNIDSSANSMVPLITNNTAEIGTGGGTWTISGLSTDGAHDHGGVTGAPNNAIVIGSSDIYTSVARDNHTHTLQVDGLHSHTFDGAWRPKYRKYLLARYDV